MSEFRLMRAECSTEQKRNASTILPNDESILPKGFDRLGTRMRRRPLPGEVLSKNLKESGLSVPELVRRAAAKGYDVSRNTVNYILRNETKNPGVFTVEAIAVALEKAPEQLAAEFLGVRSDDPGFKASQFAMLSELYKGMTTAQKQKADERIADFLLLLQHIKSQ